jgi:hypothetical protein
MNDILQNLIHDLLAALGLLDRPKLVPVPVRDDKGQPARPSRPRKG